jgi:hypothetical protein
MINIDCFICNKKIIFESNGIGDLLYISYQGESDSRNIRCHPECFFSAAGPDYRKALEYDKLTSKPKNIDNIKEASFVRERDGWLDSFICSGSFASNYQYIGVDTINKNIKKTDSLEYKLQRLEYEMYELKRLQMQQDKQHYSRYYENALSYVPSYNEKEDPKKK